jgi:ComF family protein
MFGEPVITRRGRQRFGDHRQRGAAERGAGVEQVGGGHAAQVGEEARGIGVADRQRHRIGDGQGETGTAQQIARHPHVDARMHTRRCSTRRHVPGQQRPAQTREAVPPDEAGEEQAVGFQHAADQRQRAGQVVHAVQHPGAEDEIEAGVGEGQAILVALHAARRAGEGEPGIGADGGDAARAQCRRRRPVRAAEIEGAGEAAGDAVQPLDQFVDDVIAQEGVRREAGGGAIAAQAADRAVENLGAAHRGACACAVRGGQGEMLAELRKLGKAALALALPPRCPGCGAVTADDHAFCLACWRQIEPLDGPACVTCGLPFTLDAGPDARCAGCLADPPPLDGVRAAVAYGAVARQVTLRLKHGNRPAFAETIARQMDRVPIAGQPLLVPVPLHRWRIWRRGYNQAALIAGALGRRRGLPLAIHALSRTRPTPMLRGLNPRERARAVQGVFAVSDAAAVRGRAILLIDDVYTTGATARACARALRRAGAAEVRLLAWARVAAEVDK